MKVSELIKKLSIYTADTEVGIVFDGAHRMDLQCIWLSRKGIVLLCDENHTVYDTEDRPSNAPTIEEKRYWSTDDLIESETLKSDVKNKIISIGMLGNYRNYLNVEKEEAIRRYEESEGQISTADHIKECEFDDEFQSYDGAWS